MLDLTKLVDGVLSDTGASVALFKPELALCATILVALLVRLFDSGNKIATFYVALGGSIVALFLAAPQTLWSGEPIVSTPLFSGLLIYDGLTVYLRSFLLLFVVLFLIFTKISGIPDREASTDIYTLVLGATIGMCLMASSNHLLMIFFSIEMASVPSYVLAGTLKGRRRSSEAALKYAVYGAGTAGVMLYGISLIAGVTGSAHLPTIAANLSQMDLANLPGGETMVLILGGLMLMVGLAFKLSAVPFHFWCPDVFEGATAEVNALLSVASKGAALALLVRVVVGLGTLDANTASELASLEPAPIHMTADGGSQEDSTATCPTCTNSSGECAACSKCGSSKCKCGRATIIRATANENLSIVRNYMGGLIGFLAVITCTFGNLAAYGQTNIKRMLAYSTIAHAGYMMMPVAAALALAGNNPELAGEAIGALAFYICVYLFMNLGAFAVIAFLRNQMHSEEIKDYAGLIKSHPCITVCFVLMLLSLVGIPPMAGFAGKFLIFVSIADSELWTLLIVAGLNTALSLFYYLRVIKVMTLDSPTEDQAPADFSLTSPAGAFVVAMTIPVILLGIFFSDLLEVARTAGDLFS